MEKIGQQRAMMPHTEPRQKRENTSAFDQDGEINSPMQRAANSSAQVSQLRSIQAAANAATRPLQKQPAVSAPAVQRKENKTGLPDDLKSGVEGLSGMAMDDVKVHYNSDKPAQLQAHAYAQGTDIHVAPGQEQHLAHEAWHVVQQKQGRVQATKQLKGKGVNDDSALEHEADVMGAKAMQMKQSKSEASNTTQESRQEGATQLMSAHTSQVQAPVQLRRRSPHVGTLVVGVTEDVWVDKNLPAIQGHLYTRNIGHKADKATLIAAITAAVGDEGGRANMYNWVDAEKDYGKEDVLAADPFRLRLHGTYGLVPTAYSIDVHFGPYHHGYIVHVNDGGADGEISDRDRTDSVGVPLADFSSTHHKRGTNNLLNDTNNAGANALNKERKLDASTKLIGEGARFQSVANHQANLTDSTKFFIRSKDDNSVLRWIKFGDLWLTWAATFGMGFNIPDARVKDHLIADDFKKISDPKAIEAKVGVPGDITVGRDYSLDQEAAANANDTNVWHKIELQLPPAVGEVKKPQREQAVESLQAFDGVVRASVSKTGKTYTIMAWNTVSEIALRAAMPAWTRPQPVQVVDEAEPELVEVKPVVEEAVQPPGMVESLFNAALNRRLKALGFAQATKEAKAILRLAAKNGEAEGLRYDVGTNRFIVRDGLQLDAILDELITKGKVEVEEVKPKTVVAHKSSKEKKKVEETIEQHGGKRSERGYVLPIIVVLMIFLCLAGYFTVGDRKVTG